MSGTDAGATDLVIDIWRGAGDGQFLTYRVPRAARQTVLDVVSHVQRRIDPTLSYRFACRVGMCGSCAMTVNGKPRWTCRTHVDRVAQGGRIRVAPLRNLPIINDLVVDMTDFFDKGKRAGGRFVPSQAKARAFVPIAPSDSRRREVEAGIECIGCGICHAACDVVAWNPAYLGPAALNRAWTLVNDVRDADPEGHLAAVAQDAGCHACHSHESCATHCPKHLNPTAAIAGLKRAVVVAALKGTL